MNAVILAAGRGSRLCSLTEDKPKCMVELAGKPLLKWQLQALRAGGAGKVCVVRGYRKECIVPDGFDVLENPRWAETNMVETLRCAKGVIEDGGAIISYSDIVYRPSAVKALLQAPGEIALTYDKRWKDLWSLRFEDPLKDAETFKIEGTRITDIGRRTDSYDEIQGQYMGLVKFTPAGWSRFLAVFEALPPELKKKGDMTGLLRRSIEAGVDVRGVEVDGGWCEIDSESDLNAVLASIEKARLAGSKWSHDWREGAV
jgi:choline kinase